MKTNLFMVASLLLAFAVVGCTTMPSRHNGESPRSSDNKSNLPSLPAGVTELKFNEFFVSPIGPRGLVLRDKLTSLDGKRIRMLGYMVRQEHGLPGQFLFTPFPVQIHDHDSALADDLPPATVYVTIPTCRDQSVPYAPGLMLLTGTLSVGHRDEADGRVSLVRLALDPPGQNRNKTPLRAGQNVSVARPSEPHAQ